MKYIYVALGILFSIPALAETKFLDGMSVGVGVSATTGMNLSLGYHNPDFESY